jgi:L,D-peptidoglycan transpeptidase YkuD (ErfK/YbiS/YcfS/YnhG family)
MLAALPPVPPCELPLGALHRVDPAKHQQVIIARGRGKRSSRAAVSRWQFRDGCWNKVEEVRARNGARGWHPKPWDWSYYSPIGTFGLTDAGGRRHKPRGTSLPYHHSRSGFQGPPGGEWVFDYVVAINFNRVPGRSPLDMKRPDPSIKDGGIWLHVAGRGATRGCISVSRQEMRKTLRWLDPAADPVIVMGPRGVLRK